MEISVCSFTDPNTTIWLLQNFYLLSPTPGLLLYAFYFECCERYLADSLASILFLWRVYNEFNSRLLSSLQWATTENHECLRLSMTALNLSHMGKFKGSARFIWFCHFPAAVVVSNSVLSTWKTVNFYLKFSSLFHSVAVLSHCFVISLMWVHVSGTLWEITEAWPEVRSF